MRILYRTFVWLLLWTFWLPLLILELFRSIDDWGPGGDIPYTWTASFGITLWLIPFLMRVSPMPPSYFWITLVATSVAYLVLGIFAILKLDISTIRQLAPK